MDPPIGPPVRLNPHCTRPPPPPPGHHHPHHSQDLSASDRDRHQYHPSRPPLEQYPFQAPHQTSSLSRIPPRVLQRNLHSPLAPPPRAPPQLPQSRMMLHDQFLPSAFASPSASSDTWADFKTGSPSSANSPHSHHLFYYPPPPPGVAANGTASPRHSISAASDWSSSQSTSSPSSLGLGGTAMHVGGAATPSLLGKRPSATRSPSPSSSPATTVPLPTAQQRPSAKSSAPLTTSHSAKGPAPHTHLKKQQACLTCKRRKTRCDAVRPICGACSRSQARAARGHALTAEVPPGPCCYPEDEQQTHDRSTSLGSDASIQNEAPGRPKKRKSMQSDEPPHQPPQVAYAPAQARPSVLSSGSTASPFSSTEESPASFQDSKARSPSTANTSISGPNSADMGYASLPFAFSPSTEQLVADLSSSAGSGGPANLAGLGEQACQPVRAPATAHFISSHARTAADDQPAGGSPKTKRFIIEVQSGSGGRARIQRFYKRDPARTATGEHPGMSVNNLVHPMMPPTGPTGPSAFGEVKDDFTVPSAPWMDLDSSSLPQVDLMLRQLWPELSPDLPTPDTIKHMSELFFAKHPCRTMFCKDTMMARLMLPPGHTLRPHPALIHALLAAAEPFSPLVPSMKDTNPLLRPDGDQNVPSSGGTWAESYEMRAQPVDAEAVEAAGRGLPGISNPMEMPRPEIAARNLSFGEFHLGKARREIEVAALTQNQRPLEWIQASVLIAYCLLDRCRIMELFFLSAAMVRTIAPVGLDKMPNDVRSAEWARSLCGPPDNSIMHYEQRMALWHIYLADSYGAGPPRWYEPSLADEKGQIATTMPVLMSNVQDDTEVLLSEQTLASPDLFRRGHTDTFMLHVKSACLLKRARLLTSRRGPELHRMARPSAEVIQIDTWAKELLASFLKRRGHDVDWIVAEANTCIARITLHHHFIRVDKLGDMNGGNVDRLDMTFPTDEFGLGPIMECAEMMLRTVHDLLASSFDLNLLHSQTFICWAVLVRTLEVQMRTLNKTNLLHEQARQARNAIQSVLNALSQASDRSTRAKTSLDICRAICETEMTDDEFQDLVFIWQVIPAV